MDQLRSDFALSPESLLQMTSIIEEGEKNIGRYESEILRVRSILATLEKEKRILEEQ
ncbi:hypothetical protein PQX77_000826, partial [Marasmius sp. AFHP31]